MPLNRIVNTCPLHAASGDLSAGCDPPTPPHPLPPALLRFRPPQAAIAAREAEHVKEVLALGAKVREAAAQTTKGLVTAVTETVKACT